MPSYSFLKYLNFINKNILYCVIQYIEIIYMVHIYIHEYIYIYILNNTYINIIL